MKKAARIFYIDNLRIFLIALVVLHHLSITYGASGDWYYNEVEGDTFTTLILTGFTASNQSFFMGLFFLISAYFTRISLERKPIGTFVKDRLIRLGIPLIIFYFLLSPLTIYMRLWLVEGVDYNFIEYVREHQGFGFGPMWFVETLIYFSFIGSTVILMGKFVFIDKFVFNASMRQCEND
ncbi:MAG: acyltransferase family protein [Bacteroidetes bacterium]|nr:acyltransferase family protein [Bacteroidota bacterium]